MKSVATSLIATAITFFFSVTGTVRLAVADMKLKPPLTASEIQKVLAVNETAERLRAEGMERLKEEKDKKPETAQSFNQTLDMIVEIGMEADRKASLRHGVENDWYQQVLRRLVNVGELISIEKVQSELTAELNKLSSMTEEDVRHESKEWPRKTDSWLEEIREKQKKGSKEITQSSKDYLKSLEETVTVPVKEERLQVNSFKT